MAGAPGVIGVLIEKAAAFALLVPKVVPNRKNVLFMRIMYVPSGGVVGGCQYRP